MVSDRQVGDVRGNDMAAPMAMTLTLTGVSHSKTKVKLIRVKLVLCLSATPFHSFFFFFSHLSSSWFFLSLLHLMTNVLSLPRALTSKVIFYFF